jgi:voltage-gated potassium channel Kch
MSRGAGAVIALLAVVTLIFIVLIAAVVQIFQILPAGVSEEDRPGFGETVWQNLMHSIDGGTIAGDSGWPFRTAMLIVTIFGVFVVAALISIVSSAFDSRLEELRKGRSRVLESEHTLILGWSTKVFPIISELVIANESLRRSAIVVLAPGDKVEMEDLIRSEVPETGKTKIIVRSGDPMNLTDLELGNPNGARSIILLAPENDSDPDSSVIKTALALTNSPRRRDGKYHIVGELSEPDNLEAATLVGKDEAHWVLGDDVISRITVQSCRQSGLSVVYQELLDFDGDEIYFTTQASLEGKTYFETQLSFADSAVMGLVKAGTVVINPPADTVYEHGDQIIVIAEDDSTITVAAQGAFDASVISEPSVVETPAERTLVLGFNDGLHAMLTELSKYVAEGSNVTVVADVAPPVLQEFTEMPVTFRSADTTSRAVLESLALETFNHIIVLPYKETLEPQRADAKTLITLLHLREMGDRLGVDLAVVSEMMDDRNRELAEVTKADDFIVSAKLVSLMLSQISENQQLTAVFRTLFSSVGSEAYLRPADLYVTPGSTVSFYTVLEAARRRGETAIGYRIAANSRSSELGYGVSVNPKKAESLTFAPGDKVIVFGEA